jgi:hypothetical protein
MRFTKRRRGGNRATRVLRELGLFKNASLSKLQLIHDFLSDPEGVLDNLSGDTMNQPRSVVDLRERINELSAGFCTKQLQTKKNYTRTTIKHVLNKPNEVESDEGL